AIHMTKGGVVADENTQVLNDKGEKVKGLYAAGEVTSTSAAYSAAVVFGRIAGEKAASEIK
ncbi:MAG: FAD-binding protein, partial [Cetobacterium sp.]